jgi:putative RNA 2'-phosphotransferase
MEDERLSKIISHALRHKPQDYNLELSKNGWVSVSELVSAIKGKFIDYSNLTSHDIINLVRGSNKKRHQIVNGQIRALHGHSIKVESDHEPITPPNKLFHATSSGYWEKIKEEGLKPMSREYVHLSAHRQGAIEVAIKKYKEIILLKIDSVKAAEDGILFYSNDKASIWLSAYIPPQYILIVAE